MGPKVLEELEWLVKEIAVHRKD